ncbi:putative HTH-type transcriptional regulator YhjB [subsurface metagenome]
MLEKLTPREKEILKCLVRDKSNKKIAQALGIKEQTVKNHLSFIYVKLDVENRTKAAVIGVSLNKELEKEVK